VKKRESEEERENEDEKGNEKEEEVVNDRNESLLRAIPPKLHQAKLARAPV
jgi:hypothetical protein